MDVIPENAKSIILQILQEEGLTAELNATALKRTIPLYAIEENFESVEDFNSLCWFITVFKVPIVDTSTAYVNVLKRAVKEKNKQQLKWFIDYSSSVPSLMQALSLVSLLLVNIVENKNVDLLSWTISNVDRGYVDFKDIFLHAADSGCLEVLRWIYKNGPEFTNHTAADAFRRAFHTENLQILQWLTAKFKLTKCDIQPHIGQMLLYLPETRNDIAQWLIEHFSITWKEYYGLFHYQIPKNCVCAGNLELIKWMDERVYSDVKGLCCSILAQFGYYAIVGGHIKLLKWMDEKSHGACFSSNDIKQAVCVAAMMGHFELLQWIYGKNPRKIFGADGITLDALFIKAAKGGHLSIMQWIQEIGDSSITTDVLLDAFYCAITSGCLPAVQWLYPIVSPYEYFPKLICTSFAIACKEGYTCIAQWLYKTATLNEEYSKMLTEPITIYCSVQWNLDVRVNKGLFVHAIKEHREHNDRRTLLEWFRKIFHMWIGTLYSAFKKALYFDKMDLIQWLYDQYLDRIKPLMHSMELSELSDLMLERCGVALSKWLIQTFGVTLDQIRHSNTLQKAARWNYFRFMRWLVHRYADLNKSDAMALDNYALKQAIKRKNMHMLQWLLKTFSFTAEDVISNGKYSGDVAAERQLLLDSSPFYEAVARGNVEAVKVMKEIVGVKAEHVAPFRDCLFLCAAKVGHLSMVQWLVDEFGWSLQDVNDVVHLSITKACNKDIVEWLKETFIVQQQSCKSRRIY